jgi:putative transposase
LAHTGIYPSVGSGGNSYDNALVETIYKLYKTAVIRHLNIWKNIEAVEMATLEWVDYFNNRWLPEPIGNIPPVEAKANYYAQRAALDIVA